MPFAINFLKSNAGVDSPALLSSPYLLVMVGHYGHSRRYEITPEESQTLRHWVLAANAKGRYSRGSSETALHQDLATLRRGGGPPDLLERVRTQVGRLDITPEELEGRNQRSALFKTMFLAFRANGARDWQSDLAIALDHRGAQHKMQYHHIFPKAVLKEKYSAREADDIANLAFIGGRTNRRISAKAPSEYFPEVLERGGTSAFDEQCIPTDEALLSVSAYRQFLAERRKLIARRLNEFLNSGTRQR